MHLKTKPFILTLCLCLVLGAVGVWLWGVYIPRKIHAHLTDKAHALIPSSWAVSFENIRLDWPLGTVCAGNAHVSYQDVSVVFDNICVQTTWALLRNNDALLDQDIPWAEARSVWVLHKNRPVLHTSYAQSTYMGGEHTFVFDAWDTSNMHLFGSLKQESSEEVFVDVSVEHLSLSALPHMPTMVSGWVDVHTETHVHRSDGIHEAFVSAHILQAWAQHEALGPEPLSLASAMLEGYLHNHPYGYTWKGQAGIEQPYAWSAPVYVSLDQRGLKPFVVSFSYKNDASFLQQFITATTSQNTYSPQLRGPIALSCSLKGYLEKPTSWKLEGLLDTHLVQASFNPHKDITHSFTHTPAIGNKNGISFEVGPENPRFVPLQHIPSYMIRALLLSEDASFYSHQGFDFEGLENSLIVSYMHKKWMRGGSTLSQQLSKNLFFSKERSLSRKLQEAISTLAIESGVSKNRILEIYLNIIEWGPGVFGITHASYTYFGKHPSNLTPKEAAFLASIIPNPRRYFMYYNRGSLTPAWEEHLAVLLTKMYSVGAIDEEAYNEALYSPLYFHKKF